jgi:IclR family transcriptional regulator, KDG regulon repressor
MLKKDQTMKNADPVLSVVKTMKLMEILSEQEEVGVTELAEALEGNKSTVYRFLNTLNGLGYVRQNKSTEKYSLTLKLFQIGVQALNRMDLHKAARPVMEELAEYSNETVHLASMEENHVFYLDKIESQLSLRVAMGSAQGRFAQVHCTGVGKTILSWLPEEKKEAMLKETDWKAMTEHTIVSREDLEKELRIIHDQGFGYDMEENESGVCCIAAPIFNNKDEIKGAISVSGPSIRMTAGTMKDLTRKVVEASQKISAGLGAVDF